MSRVERKIFWLSCLNYTVGVSSWIFNVKIKAIGQFGRSIPSTLETDHTMWRCAFSYMRTTEAQIRAVWSGPSPPTYRNIRCCRIYNFVAKALIRLCCSAGWYRYLLFAYILKKPFFLMRLKYKHKKRWILCTEVLLNKYTQEQSTPGAFAEQDTDPLNT